MKLRKYTLPVIILLSLTPVKKLISQDISKTLQNRVELASTFLTLKGYYDIAYYDAAELKELEEYIGYGKCYAGYNYIMMAVTEKGVEDLALFIYDSKGNLINTDKHLNNQGYTWTEFNQTRTAEMKFVARNTESKTRYKRYQMGVLIAYK